MSKNLILLIDRELDDNSILYSLDCQTLKKLKIAADNCFWNLKFI